MSTIHEETLKRLDLWLDGCPESGSDQTGPHSLAEAVASSPQLAAEERWMRSLFAQLERVRVEVRPDFADRVLAALPKRRPLWSWGIAAGLLLAFALSGVALLAASGLGGGSLGLFAAVGDFLATTLLAGAGLLGATWSGLGGAVREWLGPSPLNWAIAAAVMLSLILLLASLLRRRVPAFQRRGSSRRDDAR